MDQYRIGQGVGGMLLALVMGSMIMGCGGGKSPRDPRLERLDQLESEAAKGSPSDKVAYVAAAVGNAVILDGDYVDAFGLKRHLEEAQKAGHPDAAKLHAHIGDLLQRNAHYWAAMEAATGGEEGAFLDAAMILLWSDAIWLPDNASWLAEAKKHAQSATRSAGDGGARLAEDIRLMEGYMAGQASGLQPSELINRARDMATHAKHPMLLALAEQMALEAQTKNAPGAGDTLAKIAKARQEL
jgi:hypothetical protein